MESWNRRKYFLIVSAEKKTYEKKIFNFSSKTKIRINFVELFWLEDSSNATSQLLCSP